MRKGLIAALVLALVLGATALGGADEQADAKALIAKALKAMGGDDNVAKYRASTWKGKGTFYGMGDGLPYSGEWAAQLPDQEKMTIDGAFVLVINRDKGWVSAGGNTEEMSKEQLDGMRMDLYVGWVTRLYPLKEKGFKFSTLGESKVGNRAVVGIQVAQAGKPAVKLYFDKDTGLLAKSEARIKNDMGQEVNQEGVYDDYKEVQGLKIPMKLTIKRDGKLYVDGEVYDLKLHEKLDDKVFAKP